MILSQTSEYALRSAACIAVNEHHGPVRAKDLSLETSIPLNYLSKVLRKLVEAGILKATKGHNGGFVLSRSAKKIRILDVLQAVEEKIAVKHCIFGWRVCNSKEPCLLHNHWSTVKEHFDKWIKNTTLEDIKSEAKNINWLTNFNSTKFTGCDDA